MRAKLKTHLFAWITCAAVVASLSAASLSVYAQPSGMALGTITAAPMSIATGKSSFIFRDAKGRNIKVFSYKPTSFKPTSTIWFTMHGLGRDAEKTRDEWLSAADQNGLLILAPEFSEPNQILIKQFHDKKPQMNQKEILIH